MTPTSPPPSGAGPDELLVGYVNGSLSPQERAAVERWLGDHPEYRARFESLQALRKAVRVAPPGVDARAPSASELGALWRAIDAVPRAPQPSLPPPVLPPPPSPADTGHRASARWLLAAAAALVLVVAGVAAAVSLGADDDEHTADRVSDTVPATLGDVAVAPSDSGAADPGVADPEQPGEPDESPAEMLAALTRGADVTADARTANVVFRASADAELSAGHVTIEMVGTGQIELPDRSILDTRTTTLSPTGEELMAPSSASVVEGDGRTFVRCQGDADYTEQEPADAECFTLAFGPDVLGPDATIDMIGEATAFEITEVGRDTIAGVTATGYQIVEPVELGGQTVPLAIQIWVDEDSLIRRIVGAAEYGSAETGRTSLVVSYELTDFGVAVDIPDLG